MNILITNTTIIPMTAAGYTLCGDIGISGGKIVFIGERDGSFVADKIIDGSNHLTMPALVNAHTHLAMVLMRNYKDDLPTLQEWLSEIFPIEDKLSAEDVYTACRLAVAESIQSGVTTVCDMYFHPSTTIQAIIEGGIRANLGLTLFGDGETSRQRIGERAAIMQAGAAHPSGRITLSAAPHAIYTCTSETYQIARQWAKENGAILHTHLSETRQEVEECIAEHGVTPLIYLQRIGALDDVKCVFAHGVHLSDEEVSLLSSLDASVVRNPSGNLKLDCGIAPIASYKARGVSVALGTDGASSNNNLNMFEEMHVAALLGRLGGRVSPYEVLSMATIDGARALSLDDRIGTLEVGKEADLIMVNLKQPHLTPHNDLFSALVYSAQASDVSTVLCQGKILMENRILTGYDVDSLLEDTEARWASVLSR